VPSDIVYMASGACVGFIVGMTGVGGGSLMTPILILVFGVDPAIAVGTDLLYAAATKGVGSFIHGVRKNVDWRIVALLAAGSVPSSAATLGLLSLLEPRSATSASIITAVLGLMLFVTASLLIFREGLHRLRDMISVPSAIGDGPLTILAGTVLGFLVSISSVGAGAIGVAVLLLLHPACSTVRIVGTDIAHAVPLTLAAGIGHWMLGSVDFSLLSSLLVGSIPGIVLGSCLASRVSERGLRIVLSSVLLIVGIKLIGS